MNRENNCEAVLERKKGSQPDLERLARRTAQCKHPEAAMAVVALVLEELKRRDIKLESVIATDE